MLTPDSRNGLPHSIEAEKACLGWAVAMTAEAMAAADEMGFSEEMFHAPAHKTVWRIVRELHEENEPFDVVTFTTLLRSRGELESIGGPGYLSELFCFFPTGVSMQTHFGIVRDKAILRRIISEGTAMVSRAYEEQEDVAGILESAQGTLISLAKMAEGERLHTRSMKELALMVGDKIDGYCSGPQEIDFTTGIKRLDEELLGLEVPSVTVVAAKPSQGKTALVLNIAEHLASKGKKVGIISLEMSDVQCATRLVNSMSWVDIRAVRKSGDMTGEERLKLQKAIARLTELPIFIRDDGGLNNTQIAATFAKWKAQHGLDIGIIDHLQLVKLDGKSDGPADEIKRISNSMKPLSKRLGIPLIVLSQVTLQKDGSHSLKGSHTPEEDCDNLIQIVQGDDGTWLKIIKQREGAKDVFIPVTWIPKFQRFTNKQTEDEPAQIEIPGVPKGKKKR